VEPFTVHTGRAVPLRRASVDTDQIIPSEFLKRVTRTGFADGLFAGWREEPGFVLRNPAYAGATILLAGADFGIGSSREHAVWALQDYGFRVVISERFGDIFRNNALGAGLLACTVPGAEVESLMSRLETDPGTSLTVDLRTSLIQAGDFQVRFDVAEHSRWRLLEGLDDIAATLRHSGDIDAFESRRASWLPTALPMRPA
jgi:3-isopropylmalate/(R)-2-methylmalate dehydratase small subunit